MQIGNVFINPTAALAPMAGVADRAFRTICVGFGASYVVGEMASAKGLCYSDRKSAQLLEVTQEERPMAVQLFGDEPNFMAKAAVIAAQYHPNIIDINMGCPVPKVAGNGSGSALMRDIPLAAEIVRAVRAAVDIPITVKIRKGWDEDSCNAVEFAQAMEQAGAQAIAVHGRTRKQMYAGKADWEMIAAVKRAANVPVIGNGDVSSAKECALMYEHTGCDLVMVGRGALGAPWLFAQIAAYLQSGEVPKPPSMERRAEVMLEHIRLIIEHKGERIGMREARKHCAWYLKGMHGAAALRRACGEIESYADAQRLAERMAHSEDNDNGSGRAARQ